MDYFSETTHFFITNSDFKFFDKNLKNIKETFNDGKKMWCVSCFSGDKNLFTTGVGENTFIDVDSNNFYDIVEQGLFYFINGYRDIAIFSSSKYFFNKEDKCLSLIEEFYNSNKMFCFDNNNEEFFIFRKDLLSKYIKENNTESMSEDFFNTIKSDSSLYSNVDLELYEVDNLTVKFSVETEFPIAFDSMDHIEPHGTMRDNYTSLAFINECIEKLKLSGNFNIMDIGCAGGGLINDWLSYTSNAVGLEGSDYSLVNKRANWPKLGNKNLFTCDVTRDFQVYKNDEKYKADLITAWEVLEHLHTERLEIFFNNLANHLNSGGYFIGSVHTESTIPYIGHELHVSKFQPDEWYERFIPSDKFERLEYNLRTSVRKLGPLQFMIFMRRK